MALSRQGTVSSDHPVSFGHLPSSWDRRRLKFVATVLNESETEDRATLPYVGLEHVESGTGRLSVPDGVDSEGTSNVFGPGDILFGKLRPYLAKVVIPDFKGLCSTEFLVLRPKREILSGFLQYVLLSPELIDTVNASTYGAKMPRANWDFIGNCAIPVPPLHVQRAIVELLNSETAKIDRLIVKKERLIELSQEKSAALITQTVTQGLKTEAPHREPDVPWIERVPSHWKVRSNSRLFTERDERGYPDLPLLNVSIHSGVTIRTFAENRIEQRAEDLTVYKRALRGDIAFNKMRMWQGAVGCVPADGLVSPDYIVAIPGPGVNPKYFSHLFRTSIYKTEIDRHSYGIVRDRNRLYWDNFKQMKSLVPPLREQEAIVDVIHESDQKSQQLEDRVRRAIDRLREYRTALISAAVTGKIDIRGEVDNLDEEAG